MGAWGCTAAGLDSLHTRALTPGSPYSEYLAVPRPGPTRPLSRPLPPRPDPEVLRGDAAGGGGRYVVQPGSSVATALSEGGCRGPCLPYVCGQAVAVVLLACVSGAAGTLGRTTLPEGMAPSGQKRACTQPAAALDHAVTPGTPVTYLCPIPQLTAPPATPPASSRFPGRRVQAQARGAVRGARPAVPAHQVPPAHGAALRVRQRGAEGGQAAPGAGGPGGGGAVPGGQGEG